MKRLLIIPAAGRGTRLGWDGPKALCPVAGRPMIDHLFERYRGVVDRFVVVAAPGALPLVEQFLERAGYPADAVVQEHPTGMLPAILCARAVVETQQPEQVWITWCDQIAISPRTVGRLAAEIETHPEAGMVLPTVRQEPPYIHFVRDPRGRIVHVLQRRDGDPMPASGESDAGLFALRLAEYVGRLAEYDRLSTRSAATGERNFLPFIPWLASRESVRTFELDDAREAVGVNTPEELRLIESHLRGAN
jgi:bifunctional UDP-N-acetylglucosamine pyrophosphorylase / glucosamine-1-phosphate N-acetyltransferase